jgi:hypothetical protein
MVHAARFCMLSLATITVASSLADATPAHNVCVPVAVGVPSRQGPPRWLDWGTGTPGDEALDDPRWLGATGHSFELGAARAPLLSRALWANMAGKDYLLLSFIVDLEGLSNAGAATPRDLFLGFRRPSSFAGTGGAENAYIFQFHLTTGASASLVRPAHCSAFNTCDESSGAPKDFWRVFVDRGATGACGATVTGEKYERFVDSADVTKPPISWMTATAPGDDAVRFWKLDATQPPVLQNRWAVQLRIPIASNDTSSLEQGIPPSSTFWYQGSAALTTVPVQLYASLGWWPRELTTAICPASSIQDSLVHSELGTADKWSRISRFAGARPADCDSGLTIEIRNIGAVFNAAGGTDFAAVTPTTSFKAGGINTVIAQVQNLNTTTDVAAPLMARFRLAGWGSAPWITPTEKGVWKDMRGAENGVCGAGSPPSCSASTVPHLVDVAPHDGLPDAGTNNRAAFTFQWTIGNDATLGASEYCKFGLKPPDVGATVGACVACSCGTLPNSCDATTDTGTRANVGAATPCVSTRIEHQCMFVELTAPNGGVDFVQQSSWNNMNFDQMSTISREGLIDARQLPKRPGQRDQDIYLLVMPRNMPGSLPGGAQDGAHYVREKALERAEIVAAPYLADIKKLGPQKIAEISRQLGQGAIERRFSAASSDDVDRVFLERVQRIAPALQIMSDKDAKLTNGLVALVFGREKSADLNVNVVATIGPDEAADVVPTLEIYPFYQPLGQGNVYLPMTAFSVFLGHDGSMAGIDWVIDGATRVGQNIYHLDIPVGYARKIQVRAQAIQPPEAKLPPGSAAWPCTGCCPSGRCGLVTQVGNTLPGVIAGVFVIARRRKRKQPKPA